MSNPDKSYIEARLEKSGGTIEFVASDETLDRQGEVIPIDSWDLANFKRNPVLLVNHDYQVQNIVGRAENVRIDKRAGKAALLFEPIFHGITQLAREVEAMVQEGILNTVSVGFLRSGPSKDGDKPHNELMEISFVPVPANPRAERIRSLLDPQLSETELAAVKSFAGIDSAGGRKQGPDMAEMQKAADMMKRSREMADNAVSMMNDMMSGMDKDFKATEIQTLIFDKAKFETAAEAQAWAKDHDFRSDKVDETTDSWRLRQFDPGKCREGSFGTIDVTDGVKGVVCVPDKGARSCDPNFDNDASGRGETIATPEPGKGQAKKGRAGAKNLEIRVLQHLAREVNGALYKLKSQHNNG